VISASDQSHLQTGQVRSGQVRRQALLLRGPLATFYICLEKLPLLVCRTEA
jgi:hypothetical protein